MKNSLLDFPNFSESEFWVKEINGKMLTSKVNNSFFIVKNLRENKDSLFYQKNLEC